MKSEPRSFHILPLRAEEGSRTPDLLITNQLLYQLSYFGLFKELSLNKGEPVELTIKTTSQFWECKGKGICELKNILTTFFS